MKKEIFWTLYRKELRAYFDSFTAYAVTIVLLLISGYLFSSPLFLQNQAVLESFTTSAPLLLVFFIPAITMRLYSEEYKDGTIEILNSLPASDISVLAAKYLSALTLAAFMLCGTLVYPVAIIVLGKPDIGGIIGTYISLFLTSAMLSSIGIWASSLTRNQAVAFIIAFLIGFVLYLLGKLGVFVPPSWTDVFEFIGIDSHLENMSRGIFDSRDFIYYFGFILFFLYAAYLKIIGRRMS